MDATAELIHTVLTQTTPGSNPDGTPSKAKYVLDPTLADKVSKQASDLLTGFPLYPSVNLA